MDKATEVKQALANLNAAVANFQKAVADFKNTCDPESAGPGALDAWSANVGLTLFDINERTAERFTDCFVSMQGLRAIPNTDQMEYILQ